MPLLLKIRKDKWYPNLKLPWLPAEELEADALVDLRTVHNTLSVWHVVDESTLQRVITALAANQDNPSHMGYALVEMETLTKLDFNLEKTPENGNTPDSTVNLWHWDIVELSASKLLNLAYTIQTEADKKEILEKDVHQLLKEAISSGSLDRSKIKIKSEKLRKKLGLT